MMPPGQSEDGDDTVELEAVVTGRFGAFENPFDRVDFYLSDDQDYTDATTEPCIWLLRWRHPLPE